MQPAYEKAAKSLAGLAKVAAIDCDVDANKPFCGQMGVKGFPTLKIVRPGKKAGKPVVEDYQGPRTAKDIVDAVKDKITNHVKRLTDATIDAWVEADTNSPKAILFTDKGTTSALIKAVAIDFLGGLSVGQIRSKESASCEKYGVTEFPTLVLLPGNSEAPITYSGKFEKPEMVSFLSQAATPNPDPAPKKEKPKASATSKAKAAAKETVVNPEDSPNPIVDGQKPIELPPMGGPGGLIEPLMNDDMLQKACLTSKTGTCVVLVSPEEPSPEESLESGMALTALTKIFHRLSARGKAPKFYNVLAAPKFRKELGLGKQTALVAVNAKKGWLRRFKFPDSMQDRATVAQTLEDWIDALRMGDSPKETLPKGLVVEAPAEDTAASAATTAPADPSAEQSPDPSAAAADAADKAEATADHDEL